MYISVTEVENNSMPESQKQTIKSTSVTKVECSEPGPAAADGTMVHSKIPWRALGRHFLMED